MGRKKGSKNKTRMSPEEIKPEVSADSTISASLNPMPIPSPEDAQHLEPIVPVAEASAVEPAVVAGNMDGFKSCTRCGRDESPTVKLTVVGNEKLCDNH